MYKRWTAGRHGSAYQEYRLTEEGRSLYLVLVALRQWGERYLFEEGELGSTPNAAGWFLSFSQEPSASIVCRWAAEKRRPIPGSRAESDPGILAASGRSSLAIRDPR
ncbi:MAG: winged helix-turn-helix transcriptional regulator [Planctomycetota bacterium]|nr:MAG: winged helix-turn-helix transcriptional regulator [Planctomycetota bacterium]